MTESQLLSVLGNAFLQPTSEGRHCFTDAVHLVLSAPRECLQNTITKISQVFDRPKLIPVNPVLQETPNKEVAWVEVRRSMEICRLGDTKEDMLTSLAQLRIEYGVPLSLLSVICPKTAMQLSSVNTDVERPELT